MEHLAKSNGATKKPVVAKPAVTLVTLSELCAKNKWSAKAARVQLRKQKVKRPGGAWAWPSAEASKIEKRLKDLIKD